MEIERPEVADPRALNQQKGKGSSNKKKRSASSSSTTSGKEGSAVAIGADEVKKMAKAQKEKERKARRKAEKEAAGKVASPAASSSPAAASSSSSAPPAPPTALALTQTPAPTPSPNPTRNPTPDPRPDASAGYHAELKAGVKGDGEGKGKGEDKGMGDDASTRVGSSTASTSDGAPKGPNGGMRVLCKNHGKPEGCNTGYQKWGRMKCEKVWEHFQEFKEQARDSWHWVYTCATCMDAETNTDTVSAQQTIYTSSAGYARKKYRHDAFKEALGNKMQEFPTLSNRSELRKLAVASSGLVYTQCDCASVIYQSCVRSAVPDLRFPMPDPRFQMPR
jgi:hypothetical protein